MAITWKNAHEVFRDVVAKTLTDIEEEEAGESLYPRTKENIVFSNADAFVDNLDLNALLFYLTVVKPADESKTKEVKKQSNDLKDELMRIKWQIQEFVQERIAEKI